MAHVCILYAIENQAFAAKIERVLFEMDHSVSRREVDQDACAVLGAAGGEPDAMIVIWSAASVASPTVIAQARRALAHRTLTPVAIGKIEPPQSFQHLWPIDLSGWTAEQDDPRWRFVTDEINLSIRRSEIGFEDLALEAPADTAQKKGGFSGPVVLIGGAIALAAATIGLVALAPMVFSGNSAEAPSIAFVNNNEIDDIVTGALSDNSSEPSNPAVERTTENEAPLTDAENENTSIADTAPTLATLQTTESIDSLEQDTPELRDAERTVEPTIAENVSTTSANEEPTNQPADNINVPSNDVPHADEAEQITTTATADDYNNFDPIAGADDTGIRIDEPTSIATPPSLKPIVIAAAEDSETMAPSATVTSVTTVATTTSTPLEKSDMDDLDRLIIENTVLTQDSNENLGAYFRECVECPDMAEIPVGTFVMGTPLEERARHENELPLQEKTIPQRFAIGAQEVTFEQWDACVADGGCRGHVASDLGWGRKKRPVVNVSWEDAQSFIDWLSRKTGQEYRLPTEAEWEYAARAGTNTPFSFGSTVSADLANFNGEFKYGSPKSAYRKKTTPVASFAANSFGLFDMHGNVWEWTADCWSGQAQNDTETCDKRVLKGGAWNTGGWRLRAGHRIAGEQTSRDFDNGFRVARTLN